MKSLSVLLLGDPKSTDLQLARSVLQEQTIQFEEASNIQQARTLMQRRRATPFEVCCIDQASRSGKRSVDLLAAFHAASPQSTLVVFTNTDDPDAGYRAYQSGAQFYLPTPITAHELSWIFDRLKFDRELEPDALLSMFMSDARRKRTQQQVGHLIVEYGVKLGFNRARLFRYVENKELLDPMSQASGESGGNRKIRYKITRELQGFAQRNNDGLNELFLSYRTPFRKGEHRAYRRKVLEQAGSEPRWFRRQGRTMPLDDYFADTNFQPPRGSWVDVPIRCNGDLWGTLTLDFDQGELEHWKKRLLQPTLRSFGRLAEVAMARVKEKEDRLNQKASELSNRLEITKTKEQTVNEVLNQLQRLFSDLDVSPFVLEYKQSADHGDILEFTEPSLQTYYRIDAPGEEGRKFVALNEPSMVSAIARRSVESGVQVCEFVGRVPKTAGSAQPVNGSSPSTGLPYLELIQSTQSEACLTLFRGGRLLGAIALESPMPDAFTQEDVNVLSVLGNRISDAIERARPSSDQVVTAAGTKNKGGVGRRVRVRWLRYTAQHVANYLDDDDQLSGVAIEEALAELFAGATELQVRILSPGEISSARKVTRAGHNTSIVILSVASDTKPTVIVKIARKERMTKEVQFYLDFFTRRNVIHKETFAQLISFFPNDDQNLGVAKYQFPRSGIDKLVLFANYFGTDPAPAITTSLEDFFRKNWTHLYRDSRTVNRSLFEQYSAVWEQSHWKDRLGSYSGLCQEDAQLLELYGCPDPVTWIIQNTGFGAGTTDNGSSGGRGMMQHDRSYLEQTQQAWTHGDLRTANLFVDRQDHGAIRLIDYKRIGWGPIFQDFVELEADILIKHTGAKSAHTAELASEELERGRALMAAAVGVVSLHNRFRVEQTDEQIAKARVVVVKLRELAVDLTMIDDLKQYLWGVLLNAVYIVLLQQDRGEDPLVRQRALLLGGLICRRLEPLPDAPFTDKRKLRTGLEKYFNVEELEVLCFNVEERLGEHGIHLQYNLAVVGGGSALANKVINMIGYLDTRGYLHHLDSAAREMKPNAFKV